MPRLTPERRAEARRRLRSGAPIAAIAREYGITYRAAQHLAMRDDPGKRIPRTAEKRSVLPGDPRVKTMPPSPFRVPDEIRAEIRRLHGDGQSAKIIASRYSLHESTIYGILGLGRRKLRRITDADRMAVLRLSRDGLTYQEIRERLKIGATTVARILRFFRDEKP